MVDESAVQRGIGDPDSLTGPVISETQHERFYLSSQGNGGTKKYAPTATASSSKAARDQKNALTHALNDIGITMNSNRGDTLGYLTSCTLSACEALRELKDRSKVVDIFGPAFNTLTESMGKSGMAIEIAFMKGMYNGLFGAIPDDHKIYDPNSGVLRQAMGMATDALGINFVLREFLGAETGFGAPRRELDNGEVFSRAIQQSAGPGLASLYGALPSDDVFAKLEKLNTGGKEKFLNAVEEYGEQLNTALEKRYGKGDKANPGSGGLTENQRKSVLKAIGSDIGDYIASHGVRAAKEGEEPGVYLNGITKPNGDAIDLNNPRDVGIFINMLTGPKLFVNPRLPEGMNTPDMSVPQAAPDLSDPNIYPQKPIAEADASVFKDRAAEAEKAAALGNAAGVDKTLGTEKTADIAATPASSVADHSIATQGHRPLTGASVSGASQVLSTDGEISLDAPPPERRGTLIMGLFEQAGITAKEMLELLGLMGKDDRYEATTRTNSATGDETTFVKIYDADGNEKTIDKKGIDEKIPPQFRGTDTEITIPELRLLLAEKMLEPEKENNLAVALLRREMANSIDITLNRMDVDSKALAAMLGGNVAVGEGKEHPITFTRADGQQVTMPLKEYLSENPPKADALAAAVIQQVIQEIPEEKRAAAFNIKEGGALDVVRFEDGKITATPAQTLNEYLAQRPEAIEKAAYYIMQEREKSRATDIALGAEPAQPAPPAAAAAKVGMAATLQDLAKELGLQVQQAHHETSAPPDSAAPGKAAERLADKGSGGRGTGK